MGIEHTLAKIERGGVTLPVYDESLGRPSGGAGPVERTFMVRPLLPCTSCDHAEVCSIRPKLTSVAGEFRPPISPDPAVAIKVEAIVTCTHYRAAHKDATPEPRGTMGSSPAAPFRRAVSEADRIATSAARGTAASKAAREAGTAGSSVGSLSTIAPKSRGGRKPWTEEQRKAASERAQGTWTPERREAARVRAIAQRAAEAAR